MLLAQVLEPFSVVAGAMGSGLTIGCMGIQLLSSFYPIVLSLYLRGRQMRNHCILFLTDNEIIDAKYDDLQKTFIRTCLREENLKIHLKTQRRSLSKSKLAVLWCRSFLHLCANKSYCYYNALLRLLRLTCKGTSLLWLSVHNLCTCQLCDVALFIDYCTQSSILVGVELSVALHSFGWVSIIIHVDSDAFGDFECPRLYCAREISSCTFCQYQLRLKDNYGIIAAMGICSKPFKSSFVLFFQFSISAQ